jgi:hypothetical protein
MTRFGPRTLALAIGALLIASCDSSPTQPVAAATDAAATTPAAASLLGPHDSWLIRAGGLDGKTWRYWAAAEAVTDASQRSTLYVLGGRHNQAPSDPPATSILAYDVANDRWEAKASQFRGAATNGIGRVRQTLYISGGWNFSGDPSQWTDVSSRLFAYDVAHDRLIRKADMPRATAEGVTGVIDDKVYVLAGKCVGQPLCRDFYRYDPSTNVWTQLPPAPNSHRHGAGAAIGSKFYVAGGGVSPYRSFDVYDAATNRWSSPGLLPPRRQFAVGAAVQRKFWVVGIAGGERDGDPFADRNTVVYNPATNTWANRNPYSGPTGEGGQFLLRPFAAVRVFFEGVQYLFAVGSGHLFIDDTVKPAGTIDPGPPYIYTP